jgi:hypothetical protein
MVAARADRGVGSEEKLTPLQPNTGSGPLGTLMGRRPLPLDPPLHPTFNYTMKLRVCVIVSLTATLIAPKNICLSSVQEVSF